MTLLSICQNAADEVGLERPTSIAGSSDEVAIRCLRYAIRTGRDLVRRNIDYLIKETTFPTVASQENYSTPTDFDHFVPFTIWNRTTNRRVHPIDPNMWQELRSGLVTAQINDRFRVRGADRDILLEPIPASVETIAYEYVSKHYCQSNSGVGQDAWLADNDVGVVDEEIFELGVTWRLLNRLGMAYGEEQAEYQRVLDSMTAQILPQKVPLDGRYPTHSNIPDADFPS